MVVTFVLLQVVNKLAYATTNRSMFVRGSLFLLARFSFYDMYIFSRLYFYRFYFRGNFDFTTFGGLAKYRRFLQSSLY